MNHNFTTMKADNKAAGMHFWSAGAIQFFNSTNHKVFNGEGGTYFTISIRFQDEPAIYKVKRFCSDSSIENMLDFGNLADANEAAKAYAKTGSTANCSFN